LEVPFVVTIVVALLFSSYMLFDPAESFAKFMQLTHMSVGFKLFVLVLAIGGFACAWIFERRVFLLLARAMGKIHDRLWPHWQKQRKKYKVLLEEMRT